MFMKSIHVLIASALLLLVSCSAGDSWVRVEGNKFIDPQGEGDALLAGTEIWVCSVCGFVYIGPKAP